MTGDLWYGETVQRMFGGWETGKSEVTRPELSGEKGGKRPGMVLQKTTRGPTRKVRPGGVRQGQDQSETIITRGRLNNNRAQIEIAVPWPNHSRFA